MAGKKGILKFLASLKLAVIVLLSFAVVTAVGTIIESRYNAEVAAKLVYKTFWTYSVLGLLAVNLTAVMIDRWPWKRRHIPFLLAHIGILILLLGSVITMVWGVDGNMRVPIGGKNDSAVVNEMTLSIWGSFDGERYSPLLNRPVDFYVSSPAEKKLTVSLPDGDLSVVDYRPFALPSRKIEASENDKAGGGVRFQMHNSMTHVAEWLVQRRLEDSVVHNFGPASIVLGPKPSEMPKENRIYLIPQQGGGQLRYVITYKDGKRSNKLGVLEEGGSVDTGWMGFELKILRWLPHVSDTWDYEPQARPTQMTVSAIQIDYRGKRHWIGEDEVLKLFSDNAVYFVRYGHRSVPLGFELTLNDFVVDRYQGTMRASAYKSQVSVPALGSAVISMNEPLKFNGYTLYQASFQEDPPGTPIASIFSVNYDPGRWIKYLGSLILSLGIVWLFYDKRKAARAMAPHAASIGKEEVW